MDSMLFLNMSSKKSKNLGEQNEVFLKAFLTKCYRKRIELPDAPVKMREIESLSFGPKESVPVWTSELDQMLERKDYENLKKVFGKAGSGYKADAKINDVTYSIKYESGARPAIVNHTNREGFLKVCNRTNVDIDVLDLAVQEYWKLRKGKIIKEDVKNSDPHSPFAKRKKYFTTLLPYFIFEGTGSKNSAFAANMLLKFKDPFLPSTYKILDKRETIDDIWGHLVFSMRSKKGMPVKKLKNGKTINRYDPVKHKLLAPWVEYFPKDDEFPRGSLHIRL